jgi:hypothetical protein
MPVGLGLETTDGIVKTAMLISAINVANILLINKAKHRTLFVQPAGLNCN